LPPDLFAGFWLGMARKVTSYQRQTPKGDGMRAQEILAKAPFDLSPEDIDWVTQTLAGLSVKQRAGQLFIHSSMGRDAQELDRLAALEPAGITRFFTADAAFETGFLAQIQAQSALPMLVSADLEGSRMSLAFGTEVPNPLALAAIDDVDATRAISDIMAREARAVGINWSFTPVLDINAAFRSPIVATRGFGADPARIARHALAQLETFQALGLAATVKHWPGEGQDDRDQHLVTTINPLGLDEWEASHGSLYRQAIAAGVLSVMSAHIAFPAFVRSLDPDAGIEAFRPASVSRVLNETLLRGRLGFNGLIVSDATPMAGFGSWGPRATMLPQVIENGCDLILFSPDPAADQAVIAAAIADGTLSAQRVETALIRVLGLKAKLGLHKSRAALATPVGGREDRAIARAITARAPTLVKDLQTTLPLSPAKTRRILVVSGGILSPIHPEPMAFDLAEQLRAEGFDVTMYDPKAPQNPKDHDLMLYLFGEETLLTRGRIFLDWARIGGNFHAAMARHWHDMPCVMISFGYPYYLYDAPRMPCYINAYATMPSMQSAVLDCLMGRKPFNQTPPHDPFCGLEDARF
jgi:beta-N-acetylhexosaminidase